MKPLEDTSDRPLFMEKLTKLCELASNLDKLENGNHSKSVEVVVSTAFGQLVNICVDMIENEKGEADFEWILTCAHKWAKNLKEVLQKAIGRNQKTEEKLGSSIGKEFNDSFVALIHTITRKFLSKNLMDPLIFSKMSQLLRKFEESCDQFDLTDKDLFEPFYESKVMSKWILVSKTITLSIPVLKSYH